MDNPYSASYLSYGATQQAPPYGNHGQSATPQPSQSQSQQHTPLDTDHPVLPPLQQPQNGYGAYANSPYGHLPNSTQTPTAPPTPSTSNPYSATSLAPHHSAYPYPMSTQSMLYSTSTATSMGSTATAGLPNLRPMPSVTASLSSLPSLTTSHLGQQSFMHNEEAPTHVVGSQGRRGILPSAPGRPNASGSGVSAISTKSMNLTKDADGKFPCPHCNKTYLHAKHLKRHMLRHTGARPYSCHLCKDTFSRSDILKRHFQKCSLRRGNPSGLSHLAHQRRGNNSANRMSMSQQEGPIGLAGMPEVAGGNPYNGGMPDSATPINGDVSNRTSRANSLITPASMSHRNSINGLGIVGQNGSATDIPHAQSHFAAPNMHGYGMTNGGPMSSAYAFSQPSMNNQFYQAIHSNQQPLPYLGHSGARYDQSHSNSPHNQSPTIGDAPQSHIDPNVQSSFMNGGVTLSTDQVKAEDEKHFAGAFGGEHQPAIAQAWS